MCWQFRRLFCKCITLISLCLSQNFFLKKNFKVKITISVYFFLEIFSSFLFTFLFILIHLKIIIPFYYLNTIILFYSFFSSFFYITTADNSIYLFYLPLPFSPFSFIFPIFTLFPISPGFYFSVSPLFITYIYYPTSYLCLHLHRIYPVFYTPM